jgi:hypothetical protein
MGISLVVELVVWMVERLADLQDKMKVVNLAEAKEI